MPFEAAKQLGSEAAKRNIDAKMQRGEEAESVSEKVNIISWILSV